MMKRVGLSKLLVLGVFVALCAMWAYPVTTESACGAAASSCKNCHEVKGEKSVNSSGKHHTDHSFGDFCVFCHAGNSQASAKDEAHTGMVKPNADLEKSCGACHPDDYKKKDYGAKP